MNMVDIMKKPGFVVRQQDPSEENLVPGLFRGFWVTFRNGWSVSVQFGRGNHCQRAMGSEHDDVQSGGYWTSPDAEIAIVDPGGNLFVPAGWEDAVKGHVTPEGVLALMNEVASYMGGVAVTTRAMMSTQGTAAGVGDRVESGPEFVERSSFVAPCPNQSCSHPYDEHFLTEGWRVACRACGDYCGEVSA